MKPRRRLLAALRHGACRCWPLLAGLSWAAATHAQPSDGAQLTLHYQERPPYYFTREDGAVQGLVIVPLAAALARAGLAYRWALTPSQRQLALIETGRGWDCGVGWFRNPAREALGRFSPPLYKDQPIALISRQGAGLAEGIPMAEAVDRLDAQLLTKQGFSYGPALDALIAARPRPVMSSSGDIGQLVRMLQAGRADWMPVAPEEAEHFLRLPAEPGQRYALRLYHFGDAPPGQTRHLYCNKAVPAELMDRLATALGAASRP